MRAVLTWVAFGAAIVFPIGVAATSPLMAWRDAVYITACLAGVVAMALLFVQPLLAGGYLPGLAGRQGRRVHGWVGGGLIAMVVVHVAGLWLTSPPDMIDALLFVSPTPFSAWGVVAMWALFAAALVAAICRRRRVRSLLWRLCHTALAAVVVVGSVVHAMLIEGTMGTWSKAALCALAIGATIKVVADLRSWAFLNRRRVE